MGLDALEQLNWGAAGAAVVVVGTVVVVTGIVVVVTGMVVVVTGMVVVTLDAAIAEFTVDDVAPVATSEEGLLARLSQTADRDTSSATRTAALLAIAALVRKNFRTDRPPRKTNVETELRPLRGLDGYHLSS